MILELNETQQMLRDAAAKMFAPMPGSFRSLEPTATWMNLLDLGWHAVALPERFGGFDGTLIDTAATVWEMGRGGAFGVFPETVAAAHALASASLTERGEALLARVAKGQVALVTAVSTSSATGATETYLLRSGDAVTATPIGTPDDAGFAIADAMAWPAIEDAVRRILCVQLIGGARYLHEMAIDYARIRVQFDQPIARFQAVQHQLVDMLSALDGAELLAFKVLGATGDRAERIAAVAMTRDAVWNVIMATYNILGGVGFMEEHPLSGYMRAMVPVVARLGESAILHEAMAQEVRRESWL